MGKISLELSEGFPSSPECEKAVIGAILFVNQCFAQTVGKIESADFHLDSHRRIFAAMERMSEAAQPIDLFTLGNELHRSDDIEMVGGSTYIDSITEGLPRVSNIEHYVKVVREKSQRRKVIRDGFDIIKRAESSEEEISDIIADAGQRFVDIYRTGGKPVPSLKDVAQKCFNTLAEHQALGMDGVIGQPTGLQELDTATTGYRKGTYNVVGGRPSSGKSSLILQGIRENCKQDKHSSLFSVEMSGEDVFMRLASMETGIKVCDLRDMRTLNRQDTARVQEAWAEIAKWPLELRCGSISLRELKATARMLISRGTELIAVDYLQHPSLKVHGAKDEFDRVTQISAGLCDIAKTGDVPVVALSQLARPDKRVAVREPRMEDLRQSGQIEQDADVVVLLHREEGEPTADGKPVWTGRDKLILAKQRNGPAGEAIPVWFNGPMSVYQPRHMRNLPESQFGGTQ